MKKTLIVAKYTFIDVYRSKVMVSILFMGIGLLIATYIASEFAYGAPAKVALDFGLGLMTISNLVMAIFIGATLLRKEIEQRTLYMILSRSISRSSFLVGKILGLSIVLLINTLVLSLMGIAIFLFLGGSFQTLIIWAILFSFFEAFLTLLFAVFFSLITNTAMAIIYTVVVFIVGHSLNATAKNLFVKSNAVFQSIIDTANIFIPHYYKLNLKDFILYKQVLEFDYLVNTQMYVIAYALALLFLIAYVFKNKNLD